MAVREPLPPLSDSLCAGRHSPLLWQYNGHDVLDLWHPLGPVAAPRHGNLWLHLLFQPHRQLLAPLHDLLIVYFWTTVTKLAGPEWRSGALTRVVMGPLSQAYELLGIPTDSLLLHWLMAWGAIATEAWLTLAWLILPLVGEGGGKGSKEERVPFLAPYLPWLSFFSWAMGTGLHVGIMASRRFHIRFFSPYMIVIYFLLAPRPLLAKLSKFRICEPPVE